MDLAEAFDPPSTHPSIHPPTLHDRPLLLLHTTTALFNPPALLTGLGCQEEGGLKDVNRDFNASIHRFVD